jgi:broad specificity phosphatase PhoE
MSGMLDHAAIEQWRTSYDAVGIAADSTPPAELVEKIARADRLVASDLPRTMESAARISPGKPVEPTPLLREVPIPIPTLGGVCAPFPLWATVISLQWGFDILRGQDCPEEYEERVRAAVEWCEERRREAGESATLAVITHGVMRRLLTTRFCESGWAVVGRRSYAVWSAWELTRSSVSP